MPMRAQLPRARGLDPFVLIYCGSGAAMQRVEKRLPCCGLFHKRNVSVAVWGWFDNDMVHGILLRD